MEWTIPVENDAVEALWKSIRCAPMNPDGTYLLKEHTVDVYGGMKFEIFSDEHPPPHFRVKVGGQMAVYRISDCELLDGDLVDYFHNVKRWHLKNKGLLIKIWNETRPSECPVGIYRE